MRCKQKIIKLLLFFSVIMLNVILSISFSFSFEKSRYSWEDAATECVQRNFLNNNEAYFQLTERKEFNVNWTYKRADEFLYSASSFFNTNFSTKNFTFMINPYFNNEITCRMGDETIKISLLFSPISSNYKKMGIQDNGISNYISDFLISKSLALKLNLSKGDPCSYFLNDQKVDFTISDVCAINNQLISNFIENDYFIVVPTNYWKQSDKYTGHSSFIMSFSDDYYKNYAYLRAIKNLAINSGENYSSNFRDKSSELFSTSESSLQNNIDMLETSDSKAKSVYFLVLVIGFVINLPLILFTKNETNLIVTSYSLSFASYYVITTLIYKKNLLKVAIWSFDSGGIILIYFTLLIILQIITSYLFRKRNKICEISI